MGPKQLFIIANPVAGKSSKKRIERAIAITKSMGFEVELLFTRAQGDGLLLTRMITQEDKNHIYAVIAAGGDGTFNEVANGLVGTNIPLAILPLGTTNVLAKELRIPEKLEGAIKLLKKEPISVRPAMIRLNRISRFFLLMAGIGFDGDAVYGVNKKLKKVGGKLAYILSGIKGFIEYAPQPISLLIDGEEVNGYNAVICKASCYGGYFRMAPHADLRDPFLYAVVFKKNTRLSLLKYISGVVTARHVRFKDVIYKRASSIVIKSDRHIQIDGDYFGKGSVEINSGNQELKMFIPS